MDHLRWNTRRLAPRTVLDPALGQKQPPTDGIAHLALAPVQAHGDLTVGDLPERRAVWPRHADRMLHGFRKRSLVHHPIDRLRSMVGQPPGQTSLNLRYLPWTLVEELVQPLFIRPGDPLGHRLHRLALPVQQQALNINLRPLSTFTPPHRLHQIAQKPCQPRAHTRQLLLGHAWSVQKIIETCNHLLNEVLLGSLPRGSAKGRCTPRNDRVCGGSRLRPTPRCAAAAGAPGCSRNKTRRPSAHSYRPRFVARGRA